MRITGIVTTYNDEPLIAQCVRSLAAVCDEVLVAHDGPPRDRTVEIARTITPHVFVHERRGCCEPHLVRLLHRASHEWVVRIDADEVLSPPMIEFINGLKKNPPPDDVTHYSGIWRAMFSPRDEQPARPGEKTNRLVLFRKSHARMLGIANALIEVSGRGIGVSACIFHYAPHQTLGPIDLITKKMAPFAKTDARVRFEYPIESFGYPEHMKVEDRFRLADRMRLEHPILFSGPLTGWALTRSVLTAIKQKDPVARRKAFRWPLAHAAYQVALAYHSARLRLQGHRPSLATEPSPLDVEPWNPPENKS